LDPTRIIWIQTEYLSEALLFIVRLLAELLKTLYEFIMKFSTGVGLGIRIQEL